MEPNSSIQWLIERVRSGNASKEELRKLIETIDAEPNSKGELTPLSLELHRQWQNIQEPAYTLSEQKSKEILENITGTRLKAPGNKFPSRYLWRSVAAVAASIILIAFIALLFLPSRKQPVAVVPGKPAENQVFISPGTNRAELILDDGTSVALDTIANGHIASQGDINVQRIDGSIIYKKNPGVSAENALVYNILRTPKGGFYQLTLSDGTKLWLNAASSLRYPVSFSSKERVVELTGEGYFEVAKDATRPFRVLTRQMNVNVVGTHFNVMAYDDEMFVKTTLLEGSVLVDGIGPDAVLRPGQQARQSPGDKMEVLDNVNVDEVVAWKNGYFQFDRADLQVLMRQIERWYDVEVEYEGPVEPRVFGGKISRNSSIKDVIRILELSRVSFRLQNKKIIVSKKII